jgi:hypothetical protein
MLEEEKVQNKKTCPKILSYYFPQYHSIPENNQVFGSDFCDWDLFRKQKDTTHLNSCKFPLPPPGGLGYYDPTLKEIRQKQSNLASSYGVDGFIFYHYWLENHIVMGKVMDKLMLDGEPNIPFCLCFANESWKHCYGITTTNKQYNSFHPDGSTYRQLYDNPFEHAQYLQRIFKHENYIKMDNKPVLFLYQSNKKAYSYLKIVIQKLKMFNINDIYIIANTSGHCFSQFKKDDVLLRNPDAYSPFVAHANHPPVPESWAKLPCVGGGYVGWNSRPRHPSSQRLVNYSPETLTRNTCTGLLKSHYESNSINIYALFAWNEWAEGATLEPNTIYGEQLGKAIKTSKDIVNVLLTDDKFVYMKIEYGSNDTFIDVTQVVYTNCIRYVYDKWCIYIPNGDYSRADIFEDPLVGVLKVIRITVNQTTTIYDETKFYLEPIF